MRTLIGSGLLLLTLSVRAAVEDASWPPPLRGLKDGKVTLTTPQFLTVPEKVAAAREKSEAAAFDVARTPPTIDLAFHDQLGPKAAQRRLWSSWGDICVARDGRAYCAIGDHGDDIGGDARCFVYVWEPKRKRLRQIVDLNRLVPPRPGQPAWSKIHAKLDEGPDGKIYFSGTLNDGNHAGQPSYGFNEQLPGGQLYRYDPATGKTEVFTNLPARRCTATSLFDRERQVWWCNLEAGKGNAMWGLNLRTRQPVFQGTDGSVGFNRAFALTRNGQIIFNGPQALCRLDPTQKVVVTTKTSFPDSPGMRCATHESRDGFIYGVTQGTNQLFRYSPARDELKLLGPSWLTGEYTTVCELSPDERFLYYLPGSHGGAWQSGTPVLQYDIAKGRRKVLAFLAAAVERACDYVPAGTYGMKLSADGSILYVNFNGHPGDKIRPAKVRPNGFGLTSFAAIAIPPPER